MTLECDKSFPCTNVSLDGVKTAENFVVNNTECTAKGVEPAQPIGCNATAVVVGAAAARGPVA